ncbi:hypothetical protein CW747_12685 [Staphylococcus shinii]|nr:hypothetical protein CW747_12685 [Staphylococcus shinii]
MKGITILILKQVLKITLLIVILAEEIKSDLSKFKIEQCDICLKSKISSQLLHDNQLTICSTCASHFNDMSNDN